MKEACEADVKSKKDIATAIVFSSEEKAEEQMGNEFVYSGKKEQDVVMTNEKVIVSRHANYAQMSNNIEIERPLTSVVGYLAQ